METKEIIELLEIFKFIKPVSNLDFKEFLNKHILVSEKVVKQAEGLLKIPLDDLEGDNISMRSFVEIIKERIEYYKPLLIYKGGDKGLV